MKKERGEYCNIGITISEYKHIHYWLTRHFGKADRCENPECDGKIKKYHWSKIQGFPYEKKRENFWRQCHSCHVKYDVTEVTRQKMSESNKGKKLSESHKQILLQLRINSKHSYESRLKMSLSSRKITDEQHREIKRLKADGIKQNAIAKQFNISTSSVSYIVTNKKLFQPHTA